MGIYINEKSRMNQIAKADQKLKTCINQIGQCFHKLLDASPRKKDESELIRLFLKGVIGLVHYSCVKRELICESAKYDLGNFIEKEIARVRNKNESMPPL
jgi:hypothetical protein